MKLQSKSTAVTRDSAGGRGETWQTDATIYAGVIDTQGSEDAQDRVERAVLERTWRIRHRDDVTPQHRLVEESSTGSVWDITGVYDPTGKREELRIESRHVGV